VLIKSGRTRYCWVTAVPLLWLVILTTTAVWQKITSSDPRLGFFAAAEDLQQKLAAGLLAPEKAAVAPQLIFNQQLDAYLAMLFVMLLYLVIGDMLRLSWRRCRGLPVLPSSETPYQRSQLAGAGAGLTPAQPDVVTTADGSAR
jgi:carbon starvation protein